MGTAMAYGRVKSPGPSREEGLLGSLCCVFPVAHDACESCNFLEEDQGGLEQLVHHESLLLSSR
jgi:hypothetical protein